MGLPCISKEKVNHFGIYIHLTKAIGRGPGPGAWAVPSTSPAPHSLPASPTRFPDFCRTDPPPPLQAGASAAGWVACSCSGLPELWGEQHCLQPTTVHTRICLPPGTWSLLSPKASGSFLLQLGCPRGTPFPARRVGGGLEGLPLKCQGHHPNPSWRPAPT